MVYLSRTFLMTGDPEKGWSVCEEMVTLIRNGSSDVKDVQLLMNIAGRQDELHIIVAFESLAKEEEVTRSWMKDEKFIETMKKADGLLSWPVDSLYRKLLPVD